MIVVKYAICPDASQPPLREVAEWLPAPDGVEGVSIAGHEGEWILSRLVNSFHDMSGLVSSPVYDEFGQLVEPGGVVLDPPLNPYTRPVMYCYVEVPQQLYEQKLAEWNAIYPPAG